MHAPHHLFVATLTMGTPDADVEKQRHSRRCPHCQNADAYRTRLPGYLRPLRLLGLTVKAYDCNTCGRRFVLWGRGTH